MRALCPPLSLRSVAASPRVLSALCAWLGLAAPIPDALAAPPGQPPAVATPYRVGRIDPKANEVQVDVFGLTEKDQQQLQGGLRGDSASKRVPLNSAFVPARFRSTATVWCLTTEGSFQARPKGARIFTGGGGPGLNLLFSLPAERKNTQHRDVLVLTQPAPPNGKLVPITPGPPSLPADRFLSALRPAVPADAKQRLRKFPAPHAYLVSVREPGPSLLAGALTGLVMMDNGAALSHTLQAPALGEQDFVARYRLDLDGDGIEELWLHGQTGEDEVDTLLSWQAGKPQLAVLYRYGSD